MKPLEDALLELAEKKGFRMAFISASHLEEVKRIIEGLIERKAVESAFAERELQFFEYGSCKDISTVRSLILIACPQAKTRVIIHTDSKTIETIVPPSYVGLRRQRLQKLAEIDEVLRQYGFKLAKALVPEKTLAVRSGLARYGRNNITYIPEFGSFHVMHSYLTDAPLPDGHWGEAKMMEMCANCTLCIHACPTKAISNVRFLIRADRCLTAYTEGEEGFPEWIDPNWQESLLGCIKCQGVCPANRKRMEKVEMEMEFSVEDMNAILSNVTMDQLPESAAWKIKQLGFDPFLTIFAQNMKRIVKKAG
jgi:epoxyqueuosine reductase